MTKDQIAERLIKLSCDMEEIGAAMDYYGGFAEWARHSVELIGAAAIAKKWGREILNEEA